jgi:hypothetical protein
VLTVTALQEIPAPPGSAAVRIEVEIEQPAEDDDSEPVTEPDPVDDALVGVAKAGGGLIAGVGKMIGAVADALAPTEDNGAD